MTNRTSRIVACAASAMLLASASYSLANPRVGGAAMFENKNIVENAVNSPIHTTLVAAVKAAGLVNTLASPGPFTVFAPTNLAFRKLPRGTVDTLLKPENKGQLTKVLTAHVVPGTITSDGLKERISSNGGSYSMKTASGDTLVASMRFGQIFIKDENGGTARITTDDVMQSNGVIHVVNDVLVPK
ncbi:MAG: fasciclin domain-containing protein [Rhizobiaceae bacterium]|nr:fasciclin domain-containing protein [Rhizobiaceae bacterium]